MSQAKTKAEEAEREQRVVDHALAGLTMTEIVDREGLDPLNTKKWHRMLRDRGVAIAMDRPSRRPLGLTVDTSGWRYELGQRVAGLRRQHSQIAVSRILGMTNAEINAATTAPPTHDWKISQIFRLSQAIDMSFETLVKDSFPTPIKGFKS